MRAFFAALLCGLIFGCGILISGMANPAKVLNFFDITGSFDPSLAFVMGGALIVTTLGYRLVWKRDAPLIGESFIIPTKRQLDKKLIIGSAIFGIGWGIGGFCPGGAIPALGLLRSEPVYFVTAMVLGLFVAQFTDRQYARLKGVDNLPPQKTYT